MWVMSTFLPEITENLSELVLRVIQCLQHQDPPQMA